MEVISICLQFYKASEIVFKFNFNNSALIVKMFSIFVDRRASTQKRFQDQYKFEKSFLFFDKGISFSHALFPCI